MLTKRQLEDAAKCTSVDTCDWCAMHMNPHSCMEQVAQTALAYRIMLERACILLNDHFCGDKHYSYFGELAEVKKILEEIEPLLKESDSNA